MAPEPRKKDEPIPRGAKPRYEAPVLLPLGGMPKGEAACSVGAQAGQGSGKCGTGLAAQGRCNPGSNV